MTLFVIICNLTFLQINLRHNKIDNFIFLINWNVTIIIIYCNSLFFLIICQWKKNDENNDFVYVAWINWYIFFNFNDAIIYFTFLVYSRKIIIFLFNLFEYIDIFFSILITWLFVYFRRFSNMMIIEYKSKNCKKNDKTFQLLFCLDWFFINKTTFHASTICLMSIYSIC